MRKIFTALLVGFGFTLAAVGEVAAQSRFEANQPGFFGGYSAFGGYYDTFGDYGGRHTYNGYVRTDARNTPTTTLLVVPLQRRSQKKIVVHAHPDCSALKRKARQTGKRKWQARYEACRAIA